MAGMEGAEMQGCLSKKKLDHGRFEDPYKQKVYCWIKDGKFYLCPANNDKRPVSLSNKEVYDLNDWKVVLEDKGKFALENNHGEQIKLKSDHPTESKAWTDQITKSLRDAKEKERRETLRARELAEERKRQEEKAKKLETEKEQEKAMAEKKRKEAETAKSAENPKPAESERPQKTEGEEENKRFQHAQKMVAKLTDDISQYQGRIKAAEKRLVEVIGQENGGSEKFEDLLEQIVKALDEANMGRESAEMALEIEMGNSTKLQADLTVLNEEMDNLKSRTGSEDGAAKEGSEELKSRLAVLEQENADLQNELTEALKICEALQSQADPALDQKMEQVLNELNKQKEESQETTAKLTAAESNLKSKDSELAEAKQKLADLKAEFDALKTELAKAQEKLGSLQGAEESAGNSEALRSEIDKLQKELETEKNRIKDVEKKADEEKQQLLAVRAELDKERELRQDAERKAQEHSQGNDANPAEEDFLVLSQKLDVEVQQTKYLQEELEIAKQVIEDLQAKMDDEKMQADEIQTSLKSQLKESEETITKLRAGSDENTNKDLEDQIVMLKTKESAQEAKIAAAEKTEKDLKDRLVKQITEAEMERERLEKIIHNLQKNSSDGNGSVESLSKQVSELKKELESSQQGKSEANDRSQKLQTRVIELQSELENLRLEKQSLEALVASLRSENLQNSTRIANRDNSNGFMSPNDNGSSPNSKKDTSIRSPAAHLFMSGSLTGTPGKVAKILLGSSERHRLPTTDYLASLLDGTTEINRVGKGLLPEDMVEIAAYVKCHPKIERLFLSGNNLGVPGAQQLCNLILDQSLRLARLDLRHNNLGNEGCILILEAVAENKTINRIDLSANGITAQAAPAIAQAIGKNERLSRLDLRHNDLGDLGAVALAEAIKSSCMLHHLDLSANSIGHKGAEALAAALRANVTLQVLDLRGNAVSALGVQALEEACNESKVPDRQILLPHANR